MNEIERMNDRTIEQMKYPILSNWLPASRLDKDFQYCEIVFLIVVNARVFNTNTASK